MGRITRRAPSRAMLVSSLALFVALGGTSYAAIVLPRNSVGSAQIRPKAVKGSELATNAVTSNKVKDGSLLRDDFKPGQLVAGAPGLNGAAGDDGAPGLKGDTGTAGSQGTKGAGGTDGNDGMPGAPSAVS